MVVESGMPRSIPDHPLRTVVRATLDPPDTSRERADEVLPGARKWIAENGRKDDWFLHVHLWDPHTPYNTPEGYGNPFEGGPYHCRGHLSTCLDRLRATGRSSWADILEQRHPTEP